MVIKSVNLEIVCGITSTLPKTTLPEIAFAGRSNVGQSSLINVLINRKSYARTSSEPGKTRTINYYNINSQLYFVDLPGYGYARVSEKVREEWGKMIERYLRTSRQLKNVVLLVDVRHDPAASDCRMFEWITAAGFRPVVIATKTDKISRSQLEKYLKAVRTGLGMKPDDVLLPFSALTKQGRDEIWQEIMLKIG